MTRRVLGRRIASAALLALLAACGRRGPLELPRAPERAGERAPPGEPSAPTGRSSPDAPTGGESP